MYYEKSALRDCKERLACDVPDCFCDDRAGAVLAQHRGLAVTGTLGVLDWASKPGC